MNIIDTISLLRRRNWSTEKLNNLPEVTQATAETAFQARETHYVACVQSLCLNAVSYLEEVSRSCSFPLVFSRFCAFLPQTTPVWFITYRILAGKNVTRYRTRDKILSIQGHLHDLREHNQTDPTGKASSKK